METAFKKLNLEVKKIIKNVNDEELDGKGLMLKSFSPKNPILVLGDLSTDTGKNIQEGYMHIYAGSIQAIRNPKAHEIIDITKEEAIHFIFLASLLMKKLDNAKMIKTTT